MIAMRRLGAAAALAAGLAGCSSSDSNALPSFHDIGAAPGPIEFGISSYAGVDVKSYVLGYAL